MGASIYDVAQHAGLSIATVSRVLNHSSAVRPATVEKVERAMSGCCLSRIRNGTTGRWPGSWTKTGSRRSCVGSATANAPKELYHRYGIDPE